MAPPTPVLASAHLVGPPNGRQEEFLLGSVHMFSHLRSLTLDFPRLLSIEPLRGLRELRVLRLRHSLESWCVPLHLTGLEDLRQLRELDLSYSWIFDFRPVKGVRSTLRKLTLHHALFDADGSSLETVEHHAKRIVHTLRCMDELVYLDAAHDVTRPTDAK